MIGLEAFDDGMTRTEFSLSV